VIVREKGVEQQKSAVQENSVEQVKSAAQRKNVVQKEEWPTPLPGLFDSGIFLAAPYTLRAFICWLMYSA
jgi:hypothetical protein